MASQVCTYGRPTTGRRGSGKRRDGEWPGTLGGTKPSAATSLIPPRRDLTVGSVQAGGRTRRRRRSRRDPFSGCSYRGRDRYQSLGEDPTTADLSLSPAVHRRESVDELYVGRRARRLHRGNCISACAVHFRSLVHRLRRLERTRLRLLHPGRTRCPPAHHSFAVSKEYLTRGHRTDTGLRQAAVCHLIPSNVRTGPMPLPNDRLAIGEVPAVPRSHATPHHHSAHLAYARGDVSTDQDTSSLLK